MFDFIIVLGSFIDIIYTEVNVSIHAIPHQQYCETCVKLVLSKRLLTCIKFPFAIKIFALSLLEWPFYTGFTV